jgi:ferrous iron transport protein B
MLRIAIAGNPNSGKTTMFNSLSGCNERVGNWAGVTVSKKESFLRRRYNPLDEEVMLVDLPGAYGMNAYTNDELEASNFIKNENIDAIINVVDAANLERSLHLTSELIDSGIPVVIALNNVDVVNKRKTTINIQRLSEVLEVQIHFTQATTRKGLREVVWSVINTVERRGDYSHGFTKQKNKRHGKRGSSEGCRFDNYNQNR